MKILKKHSWERELKEQFTFGTKFLKSMQFFVSLFFVIHFHELCEDPSTKWLLCAVRQNWGLIITVGWGG